MPAKAGRRQIALLVLAEEGVDPGAAFLSAAACAPRYYALIRDEPGTADDHRGVLPDDVAIILARRVEAAISDVVDNRGESAVLIMNAGERVRSFDDMSAPSRPARVRESGATERDVRQVPLRIDMAGSAVERARWFPGREPRIVATAAHDSPLPFVTLSRHGNGIGDLFRSLTDAATRDPVPKDAVSTRRFLCTPALHAARVYFSGAWRSGFHGFLFASLHGLFWLIVLTRTWLRDENPTRSATG
ncbi:MAG: hypothetical protein ACKVU1_08705 [bacterium]